MKKIFFSTLFGLTLAFIFIPHIHTQVTIGSSKVPNKGAILDMKQDDNTLVTGATARKGLGLPRVILSDLKMLTIGQNTEQLVIPPSEWSAHTGLIVYNVAVSDDICKPAPPVGLYLWKGNEWQLIGKNNSLAPGVEILKDKRDGEEYLTGDFKVAGRWMLENMRFNPSLKQVSGFSDYIESAAFSMSNKHFYYAIGKQYNPPFDPSEPNNNWEAYHKNGILYNWVAATNGQNTSIVDQGQDLALEGPTNAIQGICPKGWHLPTDREWNELEKVIHDNAPLYSTYTQDETTSWHPWDDTWASGVTSPTYWRPPFIPIPKDAHGAAMKAICPLVGSNFSDNDPGRSKPSEQGGFNTLLIGRGGNNNVFFYGQNGFFWSSSTRGSDKAYARLLDQASGQVGRGGFSHQVLYPVRCKKDEESSGGLHFDKDIYHIASGQDKRGSVQQVIAQITNDFADKPITINVAYNPSSYLKDIEFNPALLASLPAEKQHTYAMNADPMPITNTNNPWSSKESILSFKSTNDKGAVTRKLISVNQTNYALKINGKLDDHIVYLASNKAINWQMMSNTTWKTTVTDNNNILDIISNTGGEINIQGNTSFSNFSFKLKPQTLKYNTATVTFSDTNPLKGAKDITTTITSCMGMEDRTNLAAGVQIMTDSRDGEEYFVGKFGNATWMLENLRYNPVLNPQTGFDNYMESMDKSSTEKKFYYAIGKEYTTPFDPTNASNDWDIFKQNGILYNWIAATNNENSSANTNQGQDAPNEGPSTSIRGICPEGWHLPSDREWNELEKHIYQNANNYSSYTEAEVNSWAGWNVDWENATLSSSTSTTSNWRPSAKPDQAHGDAMESMCPPVNTIYPNTFARSKSPNQGGFNVLMVGDVSNTSISSYGSSSTFWTSSRHYNNIWTRGFVIYATSTVNRAPQNDYNLYPVRCKKN